MSTRYLLLALLAVTSGRAVAKKSTQMTCVKLGFCMEGRKKIYCHHDYHVYAPVSTVGKCWAPDINAFFGGKLDGCGVANEVSIRCIGCEFYFGVVGVCKDPCIANDPELMLM